MLEDVILNDSHVSVYGNTLVFKIFSFCLKGKNWLNFKYHGDISKNHFKER